MVNWLGRSLKHKLSLLMILAVLVPVLSLGLFSYMIAEGLTEEKAKSSGLNTLTLLGANLESVIRDVDALSLYYIGNEDIQNYLRAPVNDVLLQTKIAMLLMTHSISKPYIANAMIESNKGKPYIAFKSIIHSDWEDVTRQDPDYYESHPKWWSLVNNQSISSEGVRKVITMSRPIRSTKNYTEIGMLKISLLQSVIDEQLRQAGFEGGGTVLLLDGNNHILVGPPEYELNSLLDRYYPGMQSFKPKSNGWLQYGSNVNKKTVLYYDLDNIDWRLVGIIPAQAYKSQNHYFLILTAIAVSVAALFVIALVLFLIQRVTNPLSTLTQFLKNSSPDEPLPALPVTSIDEVGELIISYNRMNSKIVKLTDEVKENESLKKEADMTALQAQINPHFLYNTLSSVHWMALMKGEDRIAEMVGSLSDFLRFSLNSGQEYCTVQQEFLHIDNYVKIQSIRYPGKFCYEANVPEVLHERAMLKLLLQPLIENAMLHGILKREGTGKIRVSAAPIGDSIRFVVEDDGIGMLPNKLNELRLRIASKLDSEWTPGHPGGSYGLRNVHNRLLLRYGPDAGLHIESEENIGTKVMFTIIPAVALKEQQSEEKLSRERSEGVSGDNTSGEGGY